MAKKTKVVSPAVSKSSSLAEDLTSKLGLSSFLHHSSTVDEEIRSPFIEYGYRNTKSVIDTFYTLFSFHNESMNIWSHLVGFVCILVAGIHVCAEMHISEHIHIFEVIAFESFIFCAALCLLLSAIYHWFGCISAVYHKCLLQLDLTGVGLLVSGSFVPGIYYGAVALICFRFIL
jgi:predicted membrane channel-forming protein YqfA (hemolysin III family)